MINGTKTKIIAILLLCSAAGFADDDRPRPSRIVAAGPKFRPVRLRDGSLRTIVLDRRRRMATSVSSTDGAKTWSKPRDEFRLPHSNMGGGVAAVDSQGAMHVILTHARGKGRPAAGLFIDLWHCRSSRIIEGWSKPKRIWEGYCGAVMDVKVLRSGRIVVPFAAWKKPGEVVAAPEGCAATHASSVAPLTGSNYTTAVYSDDRGVTWRQSPSKLTSPCFPGYNGNNYGAIEPTILQLKDGRVWMLLRTQTGFLYESFSKNGAVWSPAKKSRFHSSTSPAALTRLPDGRIALFWNNCEMPPRYKKAGVYGGRDALHAAISDDEGKTWTGFREVYRDPYRNQTPPRRGDRGTAYPGAVAAKDGTLVLVSGQGNRRAMLRVDPDWLTARHRSDDFQVAAGRMQRASDPDARSVRVTSDERGLSGWHVWKAFGPATGYWRDRTQGPKLVPHPDKPKRKVLHVRRPDDKDPDCATWNFPAGRKGELTLRLQLRRGFQGLSIALNNRYFNPGDPRGETEAVARMTIAADGRLSKTTRLAFDKWYTLTLHWDEATRTCRVSVDGQPAAGPPVRKPGFGGVSYLRLKSTAKAVDRAGVLVEFVRAEVGGLADP